MEVRLEESKPENATGRAPGVGRRSESTKATAIRSACRFEATASEKPPGEAADYRGSTTVLGTVLEPSFSARIEPRCDRGLRSRTGVEKGFLSGVTSVLLKVMGFSLRENSLGTRGPRRPGEEICAPQPNGTERRGRNAARRTPSCGGQARRQDRPRASTRDRSLSPIRGSPRIARRE